MAELKLSGFALDVTGVISSGPRGEMENQYYQKKYAEKQSQPEISIPSLKDKEKFFKEFYSRINLFNKILYRAEKEIESERYNKNS